MAKVRVTWLGEGEDGPKRNKWGKYNFEMGKAVELDDDDENDARLIEKARTNRFYEVEGGEAAPKPKTVVPPSQSSALGPVPKPGEPEAPSVPLEPQPPQTEEPPEAAPGPRPDSLGVLNAPEEPKKPVQLKPPPKVGR